MAKEEASKSSWLACLNSAKSQNAVHPVWVHHCFEHKWVAVSSCILFSPYFYKINSTAAQLCGMIRRPQPAAGWLWWMDSAGETLRAPLRWVITINTKNHSSLLKETQNNKCRKIIHRQVPRRFFLKLFSSPCFFFFFNKKPNSYIKWKSYIFF